MQTATLKRTTFITLSILLIFFVGILQNVSAQHHKNPKHPPENHDKQEKHKENTSGNNQSDGSEIFKIKVRGWDPKKKEEIVGEVEAQKSAKRGKTETDPIPFPVRGKVEIYLEIAQLAKAVNGTQVLSPGLEIEGHNLRTTLKNYAPLEKQKGVTFKIKREGLISSRVRTFAEENGEPHLYLPLEDVVKAFGGKLEFYQATGKFSIKIEDCSNCLLEYVLPDDANQVTIQVDGAHRYQTFEGFGATLTIFEKDGIYKRHDHNQPEIVTVSSSARRRIAEMLYSQLGLTRARVVLEAFEPRNDNDNPFVINPAVFDWRVVDAEINFLEQAKPLGLRTGWASSELVSERDAWRRRPGSPCEFDSTLIDEEVEWLLAAALRFRERGMELPYLAINNEPDLCGHGNKIEVADMVTIIKRLGRRLRENGIRTRFVVSDGVVPEKAIRYMQTVLDDAEARQYVGALAFHSYDGLENPEILLNASANGNLPHQIITIRERIRDLAAQYRLPVWMTEVCYCSPRDFSNFDLIRGRLNHIHDELTITNVTAFDAMNLFFIDRPRVRDELVHIYFRPDGTLERSEISNYGYLLSHYSRFIPPGSVRLKTVSDVPEVRVTAFEQSGGGLTIVAINNTPSLLPTRINLNNLRRIPSKLSVLTSRETAIQQTGTDIKIKNNTVVTALPPLSVTTYYTNKKEK